MPDKSKKMKKLNLSFTKKSSQKQIPSPLQKSKKRPFYIEYKFHVYILWIVMTALLTLFIIPSLSLNVSSLKVGDISSKDIKAPRDFSVEDQETTFQRRKEAEESVLAVYDYNDRLYSDVAGKIRRMFELMRMFNQQKNLALSLKDSNAPVTGEDKGGKVSPAVDKAKVAAKEKDWPQEWRRFIQDDKLDVDYSIYLMLEKYGFERSIEKEMIKIISDIMDKGIISSQSFTLNEQERGFIKRNLSTQSEVNLKDISAILDIQGARELLENRIKALFPEDEKIADSLTSILQGYITPNLSFNLSETHNRIAQARNAVKPSYFQIKKGEMIIREGEKAKNDQIEKLNALQQIKQEESILQTILGLGLIVGLVLLILFILLKRFKSKNIATFQNLFLIAFSILITTGIIRISLFIAHGMPSTIPIIPPQSYYFAFPFATAAVLVAILIDAEIAIMVAAVVSILSGILLNRDLSFFILAFLGSLGGVYFLSFRKNRSNIVKSGFIIGLVNLGVIIPINLIQGVLFTLGGLFNVLFGFLGGIIVIALVLAFLSVLEPIFHITTDVILLELLNLNQPLLRRLAMEAPGTYHHCIVVANLAEAASEAINANALLARVAAYYHDIGKIKMPRYYIENQMNYKNEHENLSPSMSSLILISHVKDGIELGKKYRLDPPIINIIQQHHGTSLIKYFYAKAKDLLEKEGQDVKEEDYRYPGPKPQTKEAGIVMLADAVEATSRTLTDPRPARIQGMIQNIINNIFRDGQLNECELTLKDIHQIASTFNIILTGIFHPRVIYPGSSGSEEGKKDRGGDLYSKSSKEVKTGQPPDKEGGGEDIRRLGLSNPGSEYNTRK